jgi:hypothetical protein
MLYGILLIVGAVGLFGFIVVEGADSCGCLSLLIIPVAMLGAGIYLIVSDPFESARDGTVLGDYRDIALHDGQGLVITRSARPYRVDDTSGATVAVASVDDREMLVAGILVRLRGRATFRACSAAVGEGPIANGIALTDLRAGESLCVQDSGAYEILDLLRVTAVEARAVVVDVTVWKGGAA